MAKRKTVSECINVKVPALATVRVRSVGAVDLAAFEEALTDYENPIDDCRPIALSVVYSLDDAAFEYIVVDGNEKDGDGPVIWVRQLRTPRGRSTAPRKSRYSGRRADGRKFSAKPSTNRT